jgi:inorganic pyrophosphatase
MDAVLKVEVVIEIPRGSFIKRDSSGRLDFVSPFPCPFNYGSVDAYIGSDGAPLDAVVLGPRLRRNTRITAPVIGAVRIIDCGMIDDKLICSDIPVGKLKRTLILLFFKFYAKCKGLINLYRGDSRHNRCAGWREAKEAIEWAKISKEASRTAPGRK